MAVAMGSQVRGPTVVEGGMITKSDQRGQNSSALAVISGNIPAFMLPNPAATPASSPAIWSATH